MHSSAAVGVCPSACALPLFLCLAEAAALTAQFHVPNKSLQLSAFLCVKCMELSLKKKKIDIPPPKKQKQIDTPFTRTNTPMHTFTQTPVLPQMCGYTPHLYAWLVCF